MASRRGRNRARVREDGAAPPPEAALAPGQTPRPGSSPVRMVRDLEFDPPLAGRAREISRSIGQELGRHGCSTRRRSHAVVEFDGPSPWSFPPSLTRLSASLVQGGTVTLLPAEGRLRLELRFDVVRTYAWPGILLYIFAAGTPRAFALWAVAAIAALWVPRYVIARWLFAAWVRSAALDGAGER